MIKYLTIHMKFEEVSWYSERLNRYMRVKVYGHYGPAFIVFPCQGKQSDDFANNGMIDVLAPFIEEGRIKLFCLDSNDDETVDSQSWDKAHAGFKLEMYHQYLVNEVLPFVYDKQGGYCYPYLIGCSMGASHAVNNFLRRPELFSGFIALSGKYDIASFFGGYMNSDIYNNSPTHYLRNMPSDHSYINLYNSKTMIAVVGKGAYEHLVLDSNYELANIAREKGINIDFNFWDENSIHDWPSWRYQLPYFLNKIL
jgi:esterase/lipase superfamily enzyme